MKNYLELLDTKFRLLVEIDLEFIGSPNLVVSVGSVDYVNVNSIQAEVDLLTPFGITIKLMDKDYNHATETAVVIQKLSVDGIAIIPEYTHHAVYDNDHGFGNPTNYLGFNGQWTLDFDRPFYQWLHQAKSQGWLLG